MQKNINIKNVKEYVKKINIRNHKVNYKVNYEIGTSAKKQINETKIKYIKVLNIQKCTYI